MFETHCEKCSADGVQLHSFQASCRGVSIQPDGFDVSEATQLDTSEEEVICRECHNIGPLRLVQEGE